MFPTEEDLDPDAVDLDRLVMVEEHPVWPGCLIFHTEDHDAFYRRYSGWMSRYQVLSELFSLGSFYTKLLDDGWSVVFSSSALAIVGNYHLFNTPLTIPEYKLHPFQNFAIQQALHRANRGAEPGDRLFFWNWAAGAGKSYVAGVAAHLMLKANLVELVIVGTSAKTKRQLHRFIEAAGVDAVINDHAKPAERRKRYFDGHRCYVMNFEKFRLDADELGQLTRGKRVLFILDEAHRLISEAGTNQARKNLDKITKACAATVWPMSATVVDGNPLRYRDVFSLDGYPRRNPLGTKEEFCDNYAISVKSIPIKAKNGARFSMMKYSWDLAELHEVRHRVTGRTMAVRKSDDALKDTFQGMECWPVRVPLSEGSDRLLFLIEDDARKLIAEHKAAKKRGEDPASPNLAPHYMLSRMVLCTPMSLLHSGNELGRKIAAEHPHLITDKGNEKLELLNEMCENIRESGDKVVIFCWWNEMGAQILARQLRVPHVLHHGEMSSKQADTAIEKFKTDPDVTALFTTDAGAEGLNLQCARYVISVDPKYSYDKLYQRNSRIDRSDSHLDGLTGYVMITEGTIEERIWGICDDRRKLAEAVQGTEESLTYEGRSQRSEGENRLWLLFGDEEV